MYYTHQFLQRMGGGISQAGKDGRDRGGGIGDGDRLGMESEVSH